MKLILAFCIIRGTASFAAAIPFAISFDGLQNGEQVLNYYDGSFGGSGSGPGPLLGISFTSGLAADSTSTIAFGPSGRLTAPAVTMNLDDPWDGLISFYFAGTGLASFYPGRDASGSLVRSFTLSSPSTLPFGAQPGSFQSVVFGGTGLRVDSITFGAAVIPEPQSLTLLLCGTFAIAGVYFMEELRRRRIESTTDGL